MKTLHPTPLAACLSAILALTPAVSALATTRVVTSCDDSAAAATTPGTLRFEIGAAADHDTISLATLACSTITLQSGEIKFTTPNLTIVGNNSSRKTISGNLSSRVFNHYATGTLEIDYLTITSGRVQGKAVTGGCIASSGSVTLTDSTVTGCAVTQTSAAALGDYAQGGGVFARNGATLVGSVISGNVADASGAPHSGGAQGGGIFVGQVGGVPAVSNFDVKYSAIENNTVLPPPPGGEYQSWGGGAFVSIGNVSMHNSTISGNYCPSGGGMYQTDQGKGTTVVIANSTISGNRAKPSGSGSGPGGLMLRGAATIENSTIAFNNGDVGGLRTGSPTLLRSDIIANNVSDFQVFSQDMYPDNPNLSGSDNLIQSIGISPLPAGLVTQTADPQLSPLGNHGGSTKTHALLATSPAIGQGNNFANLSADQRGPGYPRPSVTPDMGAYQRQPGDDEIYFDGFGH